MEKRKPSNYNKLQKAAAKVCDNPSDTNKTRLDNAIDRYKKSASKAGKKMKEINSTIRNTTSCKTTPRKRKK